MPKIASTTTAEPPRAASKPPGVDDAPRRFEPLQVRGRVGAELVGGPEQAGPRSRSRARRAGGRRRARRRRCCPCRRGSAPGPRAGKLGGRVGDGLARRSPSARARECPAPRSPTSRSPASPAASSSGVSHGGASSESSGLRIVHAPEPTRVAGGGSTRGGVAKRPVRGAAVRVQAWSGGEGEVGEAAGRPEAGQGRCVRDAGRAGVTVSHRFSRPSAARGTSSPVAGVDVPLAAGLSGNPPPNRSETRAPCDRPRTAPLSSLRSRRTTLEPGRALSRRPAAAPQDAITTAAAVSREWVSETVSVHRLALRLARRRRRAGGAPELRPPR